MDPPRNQLKLDGEIEFYFEEVSNRLQLKLRTERIYGSSNNDIIASLQQPAADKLRLNIEGILECYACQGAEGPARATIDLPQLDGQYELTVTYQNQLDAYDLTVTEYEILLQTKQPNSFTSTLHDHWKRLPAATVWIVIHNAGVIDVDSSGYYLDQPTFDRLSQKILNDFSQLSLKEFVPSEGYYTNQYFVAPWPSWHEPMWGGYRAKIPSPQDEGWYEFNWPIIKYYYFEDEWQKVISIIDSYKEEYIYINAYSRNGDIYLTHSKTRTSGSPLPKP